MSRRAQWTVVYDGPTFYMIRDAGDPREVLTCTNDAENVVARLLESGALDGHLNLYVYDTFGDLDEYVYAGGVFTGFKSVSPWARADFERLVAAASLL